MKTQLWSIAIVIIATILMSFSQILFKLYVDENSFTTIFINWKLLIGILVYIVSGILLILSFKGGQASTLYLFLATSYIWVALLASHFLGESLTNAKSFSIAVILLGMFVLFLDNFTNKQWVRSFG